MTTLSGHGRVVGVVAAFAATSVSVGVAWALNATTNPPLAVASVVRDHTPGPLALTLIHLVGHADKPLLIAGTLLVTALLGMAIGQVARRSWIVGVLSTILVAALGIAAILAQPHYGSSSLMAAILGLLVWLVVLRVLTPTVAHVPEATPEPAERRTFLLGAAAITALSLAVLLGGRLIGASRRAVEQARGALRLPITRGTEPPLADLGVAGISPWRTPASDFYSIDTALTPPAIEPSQWKLRIHGMVDREITLSYEDLLARRRTEAWVTLCCVSNPVGGNLIGNAWWSGVRIRDLLAEAGVHAEADAVKQTSYDGWTCGTPIGALTDDRMALLAVGMNGDPLPIRHGFPVRMVVPGLYGYVSATKWLVDLEVTRFDRFEGYWTSQGWSPLGPVKTQSRIEVPADGSTVPAGDLSIGGVSWAQHTGIATVEVQLDGGPWQRAELGGIPNNDTWVQWRLRTALARGSHRAVVRTTDKSGYQQTAAVQDVVPDGATGRHQINFKAH